MDEEQAGRLSNEEVQAALDGLTDWNREGEVIVRTFRLKDFGAAMNFVNAVAELAESAQHHPDIDIRYNKVRLVLTTHDSGGITLLDLAMAGAIDRLRPDV